MVTTTSDKYNDAFGFTQEEVAEALAEFGVSDMEPGVREWYDGFTFGNRADIYIPWSILNFLDKKKISTYWANTSSNSLVGELIRKGSRDVKMVMEDLLEGGALYTKIDEQIVFSQLDYNEYAIWSLLLASGYLKVEKHTFDRDTGNRPSESAEPERFYHGFVLGLMVELSDRYAITSNRESGFGRYDVMMEPLKGNEKDAAIVMEFKVYDSEDEKTLKDTVKAALSQIEEKQYAASLEAKGIPVNRIRKYGFAFKGYYSQPIVAKSQ